MTTFNKRPRKNQKNKLTSIQKRLKKGDRRLKRKLLLLALLVVAICLITPCVSANAQIIHDKQTILTDTSSTETYDLEPEYYPYTQAKFTVTLIGRESYMYNQVTDARGHLHINGKVSGKGTLYIEAWAWDDTRHEWILGQQTSQSQKAIFGYNELSFDSQIQTSKETRLIASRNSAYYLDLETGQTITLDVVIIEHVIVKYHNGELQFQKSFEISRGAPDL
jgi:hypothetical protein